jgi:cell division inhibitor SepF
MGLGQSLRAVVEQFGAAQDEYEDYDDYADDEETSAEVPPPRSRRTGERDARPLALVRPPQLGFALVAPQDFDDAKQIADRLRADGPVIVDVQSCGPELAKRLIDFCSGLTYGLEGSLEFLGEKVVLLAPHRVELSSESVSGLQERRFFNQA